MFLDLMVKRHLLLMENTKLFLKIHLVMKTKLESKLLTAKLSKEKMLNKWLK